MNNRKLRDWCDYFEWLCAKREFEPGSHAHYSEEYCTLRSLERSIFVGQTSGWMIDRLEQFQFPTYEKAKVMMILGLPVNSSRLEHELRRKATEFEMDSHKRIIKFFIREEDIEYISNYTFALEDDEDKQRIELPGTDSEDEPRKRKLSIEPETPESAKIPRNDSNASQEYPSDLCAVEKLPEDVLIKNVRSANFRKEGDSTGANFKSNKYKNASDTELDDEEKEEEEGSENFENYEEIDLDDLETSNLDQNNENRQEILYLEVSTPGTLFYDVFLRMLFNFFNKLLKEKFIENEERVVENFQITNFQFDHCIEIDAESLSKAFHQALTVGIFSTQSGPEMILKDFFVEVKDKFLGTVLDPAIRNQLRRNVASLENFTKTYRTISLNQAREISNLLIADFKERIDN